MKKSIKLFSVLLMVLALLFVSIPVFANNTNGEFKPENVEFDTSETNKVQDIGADVLGIVRVVGTIVAVGILIILGIKYMMGSAEERAEYKKTLLPYFVGAILIFAATNLAGYIYDWAVKL